MTTAQPKPMVDVGLIGDATVLYRDRMYANAGNPALLALIDRTRRTVIDVGCGAGDNARLLQADGHDVWGITASEAEAERARAFCHQVALCDIEVVPGPDWGLQADVLLFSHVLEHLRDPQRVLSDFARFLRPGGIVAIAVPNMAHWRVRRRLLSGDWSRDDGGPFDATHLQFWSYRTATTLFQGTPFTLLHQGAEFSVPLWPLRRLVPRFASAIDRVVGPWFPNVFGHQTLLLGEKTPTSAE